MKKIELIKDEHIKVDLVALPDNDTVFIDINTSKDEKDFDGRILFKKGDASANGKAEVWLYGKMFGYQGPIGLPKYATENLHTPDDTMPIKCVVFNTTIGKPIYYHDGHWRTFDGVAI